MSLGKQERKAVVTLFHLKTPFILLLVIVYLVNQCFIGIASSMQFPVVELSLTKL